MEIWIAYQCSIIIGNTVVYSCVELVPDLSKWGRTLWLDNNNKDYLIFFVGVRWP